MPGLLDRLARNPYIQFGTGMSEGQGRNPAQQLQDGLYRGILNRQNQNMWDAERERMELNNRIREQQVYQYHYENAVREAQAERNRRYKGMLSPEQDAIAGAMGYGAHAEMQAKEASKLNEMVTYWTPKGPQRMPKWAGDRAGLLPYDVYLKSEEATRAQEKHGWEEEEAQREQQESAAEMEAARVEQQDASLNAMRAAEGELFKITNTMDTVDRAIQMSDKMFAVGGLSTAASLAGRLTGQGESAARGTDARDMENLISTIQ